MSEYQHFEWQTIDRPLTEKEQEAVEKLSSHIEVSASRAVVTYSWGDFKHNPRQVLERFFDAHLYLANWGSRRLMFRFPAGLVKKESLAPYGVDDVIEFETEGRFDILDINLSEEEGGWIDEGASLSGLIALRNDVLHGDYRVLYLAWMKALSMYEEEELDERDESDEAQRPPPIPPGLKQLSPALERFVSMFDIDPLLVEVAAEASPALPKSPALDFRSLARQLSREEADEFLSRVAEGDGTAGPELAARLRALAPSPSAGPALVRRSFTQLRERSEALEAERELHRKEAAHKKHVAEMEALVGREEETWRKVEELVGQKTAKQYDEAVQWLSKLKDLSIHQDTRETFRTKVAALRERYRNRPAFLSRVDAAALMR